MSTSVCNCVQHTLYEWRLFLLHNCWNLWITSSMLWQTIVKKQRNWEIRKRWQPLNVYSEMVTGYIWLWIIRLRWALLVNKCSETTCHLLLLPIDWLFRNMLGMTHSNDQGSYSLMMSCRLSQHLAIQKQSRTNDQYQLNEMWHKHFYMIKWTSVCVCVCNSVLVRQAISMTCQSALFSILFYS